MVNPARFISHVPTATSNASASASVSTRQIVKTNGGAERGFKDTTKANPGYFTTIRARFDLPAGVTAPQTYVHHCHIVEHEDNDMMLPFIVEP